MTIPISFSFALLIGLILPAGATSADAAPRIPPLPKAGVSSAVTSSLPVTVSESSVDVAIPSGCTNCRIEVRLKNRKEFLRWRTFSLNGKPSRVSVRVPKGLAIGEWRAVASIDSARAKLVAQSKKYPDAFYQGKRAFGKIPASGYQAFSSAASDPLTPQSARVLTSQVKALSSVLNTGVSTASSSTRVNSSADQSGSAINNQITEADIWKTDGNTVYFFNQLRGLQVIDLSDPSNPKLTASLRMPATGQDLYILPGESPGEKLAVLLARNYNSWASTDVVVVKIAEGVAQEVSRTSLNGSLSDSRMLANRLYTVTTDWSSYYDAANVNSGVRGSTNLSQHLILVDGSQVQEKQHKLPLFAGSALIAAGNNWLAVSSHQWESDGGSSQINLFSLDDSGASPLSSAPIKASGWIYDKFKISYENECLRVVSVSYANDAPSGWWWSPVTKLENFDLDGNLLASLEIVRDEQLYATRFTGGKMYAVTFRQEDPLWVVDIADARNPVISGKLEVPGFSTYLEPIGEKGEFLFAIGLDAGAVVASLFDVHDPSNPTLASRVELDERNWGYSEAVSNEKALKVLPEEGLALIPFNSGYTFDASTGAQTTRPSFVRLIDISLLDGGSLNLRGRLQHNFEPRRAALVNGILTSISQKELITANIDDRDNPAVLAEVSLAWPVNQVIQSGNFVLQISDGSSAVWSGESAVVRISKASAENAILADVDLGEGTVQDAVLRDSKLYVLRKNWGPYTPMVRFVRRPGRIVPSASEPELALDIYDASALPSLPRLGSTAVPMTNADTNCTVSNLLWATDTLPVVLTQARPWYGYYYPMICGLGAGDIALPALGRMSASSLAMAPESDKRKPSLRAAMIRAFDVSNPKTPTALPGVPLPGTSSTVITVSAAGDGMVVFGYGESPSPWRPLGWPSELDPPLECFNRVGMVNLSNPRRPIVGAPVLLPGKLFAVTDISRSGFLAFTESVSTESTLADKDPRSGAAVYSTPAEPTRQVQASLVADSQASMFASVAVGLDAKLTAQGRNLYCATANRIDRFTLSDEASFTNTGSATTNWTPGEIQMRGISLVGAYGNQLMRVSWPGLDGVVENFKASQGFDLTRLTLSLDGSLLVPMGDYGVEKLKDVPSSSTVNWPGIFQNRIGVTMMPGVMSRGVVMVSRSIQPPPDTHFYIGKKGVASFALGPMSAGTPSAGPASMAEAVPLNIPIGLAFTNAEDVLNLELGGLLRSNDAQATTIGTTALPGTLTVGGTATSGVRELVAYVPNQAGTLTINSIIRDLSQVTGTGSAALALVKSGSGTLTLSATNTYTGGTTVSQAESSGISRDMIVPQPISNPVGTYGSLTLSDETSNGVAPLNSSPPLVFTQGAMLSGTPSFTAPSTTTGTIAVAGGALTVLETATLLGGGNIFVQQGGNLLLGNRHLNAPLIVGVVGAPLPESNASSLLISAPTSASGGLRMVGGGIGAGVVNVGSSMLTLNGTNSYTGGTYLASGSLVISGSAPLSLTKMGEGLLAGAQTLTGWTTISAGTVALRGTLNSTALTLASGGAITVSASNRLILTGTNAISYVTAGLVNTELLNSTLGTYPPVSLSSGIGTLSISSGITTSGGTLVLVGSSAGTGN